MALAFACVGSLSVLPPEALDVHPQALRDNLPGSERPVEKKEKPAAAKGSVDGAGGGGGGDANPPAKQVRVRLSECALYATARGVGISM